MKHLRISILLVIMLAATMALGGTASAATPSIIDFEGLGEGDIITSLSSGSGISGPAVAGSVAVYGEKNGVVGTNAAMIFDSECDGNSANCTGGDFDLFAPGYGKTLIASEDFLSSDPDDNAFGGFVYFDFSGFGTGLVDISTLNVLDTEGGGTIELFLNGSPAGSMPIPMIANGTQATVNVGATGVSAMKVTFAESGAVDNIRVTPLEEPGDQGCTPGYWKNLRKHGDSWTVLSPQQTVASAGFNSTYFADTTLVDALAGGGGRGVEGAEKILLRAAVAGLLNIYSGDVAYATENAAAFIADVNAALASGNRSTMLSLGSTIDGWNNGGCPLN